MSDSYHLRIRVTGNGVVIPGGLGGACADDCTYLALRGKTVELEAIGREDVFHRWKGRCGRGPTCKVEMTSDVVIGAAFGLDRYEPAWAVPLTSSECVMLHGIAAGNRVVVTGDFSGTRTFGSATLASNGDRDALIASLKPANGEIEWTQRFGGTEADVASWPSSLPGSGVVAGLSLSPGATVGGSSVASREDRVAWIDEDDGSVTGSVPVSGSLRVIRRLDDGGVIAVADRIRRATVTRLNATGTIRAWSTDLAASDSISADGVAIGPSHDVFVVGTLNGVPLFSAALRGPGAAVRHRPFLVRLDGGTGAVKSARWIEVDGEIFLRGVASDGRQLVVAGNARSPGVTEGFILGMSFEGRIGWERHNWRKSKGQEESGFLIRSIEASRGSSIVVGEAEGEIELRHRRIGRRRERTSFLLEVSATGDNVWAFAMPDGAQLVQVARDREGDLYVTGYFREPFTFGSQTVSPGPSGNPCGSAYLAKLARTGDRSARPRSQR